MTSLLEKAKTVKSHKKFKYTDEHIGLALSWAKDGVKLFQVSETLGSNQNGPAYRMLAICLKEASKRGLL